jgi:hypothetical protein
MAAPSVPPAVSQITILSPVRRLWTLWLRTTWPFADRLHFIKRPLLELSFIHVAHWALVDRLPAAAPRRRTRRLRDPYVLFQTNFDEPTAEYVEAFAIKVPGHVNRLWWGAYGFPGPRPQATFVNYVLGRAERGPSHSYCAYPHGTVRTVRSALVLRESFERFRRDAAALDDQEFAKRWRKFLTTEQRNL